MIKTKGLLRTSLLLATAALFAVGCSDDNDSNPIAANPAPAGANVRVIHTSYDAPAVDVSVDGSVAITNLDFGQSSGYAEIPSGTRNIAVTPTGAASPVVINADLTLAAGAEYTVLAIDELSQIDALVIPDSRTPNSNKAKVRFVHAAPDAPAVDIKLNDGSGPAVFADVAFGQFESYVEVDGGSYTFAVTAAGSTSEVFIFDPISVQNGGVYTVVAQGTLDATDMYDFTARVFVDNNAGDASVDLQASQARVMTVHASPDAPAVDLVIDNATAGSGLAFPNATSYLDIPAGTRNVKVAVTANPSVVAIEANLSLMPNGTYSVFAVDNLSNIAPLVIADDLTTPASGKAHVRFLHLSPDAPAVDIAVANGGPVVFSNYEFKDYSDFTPLDAGTYDLEVRLAGTNTVVLPLPGIMLSEGTIYTVFAKGLVGGTGDQALSAQIIVNN